MFKQAMFNLLFNIGIFGSFVLGFWAYQQEKFVLVFISVVLFVVLLLQKIRLLKQIRNSGK
jgi:hypothetical protein